MRSILAVLGLILLSACAIQPRAFTTDCGFRRHVIDVKAPVSGSTETLQPPGGETSEGVVLNALRASGAETTSRDGRPVEPAMLFLSGGSQHGAFGAGYLAGWKTKASHLPKFAVVTGISTGAILSTFAFIDRPEDVARAYAIRHERELLTPLVSVRNGSPTPKGYAGIVRKGAIADLAPLRGYLARVLTDDVLTQVAQAVSEGRVLRTGVVDVDTGQAVALDLTDMAHRWAEAGPGVRKDQLKACYVEAIVASSSAPLAALPVFIDQRMYIDGGARFGAFSHELESVIALGGQEAVPLKPVIYLIINGDQRIASRCGRKDEVFCDPPRTAENEGRPLGDPPASAAEHAKWQFLKLALRSEQILANQVYRFSADSIAFLARRENMKLNYVQIDPDMQAHSFHLEDDELGEGTMTCATAYDLDKARLDPVQFYPRYMRCLIDYGRTRGAIEIGRGR